MLHRMEPLEARRMMDAGDLDTSFGQNGVVEYTGGAERAVRDLDLEVDQQGGLVLAGIIQSGDEVTGTRTIEIVRTHADGTPISEFGDNGRLVMSIPTDQGGLNSPSVAAHPTPDGGILLRMGYRLWKLRANGALQKSFAHNGRAAFAEFADGRMAVDVDAEGRIYVAGPSGAITDPTSTLVLHRLNPDGSLDTTFGGAAGAGTVRPAGLIDPAGFRVKALRDGRVIVASDRTLFAGDAYTAVRLTADGMLDTSYGEQGVATGQFVGADDDRIVNSVSLGTITDAGELFLRFSEDDQNVGGVGNDTWAVNAFDATGAFTENVITDPAAAHDAEPIVRDAELFVSNSFLEGVRFLHPDGSLDEAATANADVSIGATEPYAAGHIEVAADGSILVSRLVHGSLPDELGSSYRIVRLFRNEAPAGQVTVKNLKRQRDGSYRFSVTWRDDEGVRLSTLGDNDLTVGLPGGVGRRRARLVSVEGEGDVVNATYLVTSPDGRWDASDNGRYDIRIERRSVRDVNGNAAPQRVIGNFIVQIPSGAVPGALLARLATRVGSMPILTSVDDLDLDELTRLEAGPNPQI